MTVLGDELLRHRLEERASGDAIALGAMARSVVARPQVTPRAAWPTRLGLGATVAAAAGMILIIAGLRGTGPGPASSGATWGSLGGVEGSASPAGSAPAVTAARWIGLDWVPAPSDAFASGGAAVTDVIALDGGFLAVGTTQSGDRLMGRIWRSPDGRSWAAVAAAWSTSVIPQRIFAAGGRLAIVAVERTDAGDASPAQLWTSRDGETWARGADLPAGANGDRTAGSPAGLLTIGTTADRHSHAYILGAGSAGWVASGDWPSSTSFGRPAWSAGSWLIAGTIDTDPGQHSQAAVWRSADGATWSDAAVEDPAGGLFEILPATDGLFAVGTGENLCSSCFGAIVFRDTFWNSEDGRTWKRLAGDPLGLPLGFGTGYASDGRRIVAIALNAADDGGGTPRLWASEDGRQWSSLEMTGATPNGSGALGVGRTGVVILPAGNADRSTTRRGWFGTPITSTEATPPSGTPAPTPVSRAVSGCEVRHFSAIRCAAIVARAVQQAGNGEPVSVQVGPADTSTISLGSSSLARVVLHYADGSTRDTDIRCFLVGGESSDRVCSDDPQIVLRTGVSHDIPCGPTPGDDNHPCVPPPTPRPASIAASEPLVERVVDVPIDHLGHYEVEVGAASLPDGAISQRDGTIGDPRPTGFWIDGWIDIQVRSDIPGRPIADSYNRDRYDGPEPVHVFLIFDVTELTGGGTLEIRNLAVR